MSDVEMRRTPDAIVHIPAVRSTIPGTILNYGGADSPLMEFTGGNQKHTQGPGSSVKEAKSRDPPVGHSHDISYAAPNDVGRPMPRWEYKYQRPA